MTQWILDAAGAFESLEAGGKARGLARAEAAGFNVPTWFVVLPSACLAGFEPHDGAAREIVKMVDALGGSGERYAVRSSARDEDGREHSFAGQLESHLNVAAEDVLARVADVWRSASNESVAVYRRERGLPDTSRVPAVIVQRMVEPRAAGVAFSADPVSGRRTVAVVSAVHGLGAALVSGEANADTWLVERDGTIVERRVLDRPALTDADAVSVARLAVQAEALCGQPQDVEWALTDRLELLQMRPITTLHAHEPEGPLTIWDNSNIVESYSGVTTPLTFSFVRDVYTHVYREFCGLLGVPRKVVDDRRDTFENMLGLVRGRLYYNLLNWYRVLALLPGYSLNSRFMEQMMGVKEPLPAELAARVTCSSARGRLSDALHVVRTLAGLIVAHTTIDRRTKAFKTRLDRALASPVPSLEAMRADELVAHYRALRAQLLLRWDAPLVNDFLAMLHYGISRRLAARWCDDVDGSLQNDLVRGGGVMISAEPARRLKAMAWSAADDPALIHALASGDRPAIDAALQSRPDLDRECRAYLDKFGERTVNELKLESATLHDDPIPLFRAIGSLAQQLRAARVDPHGGPETSVSAHTTLDIRDRLRNPLKRLAFRWVVRNARRRVCERENLRLERTRLFGRVRRVFVELGRRLHASGLLDDPRDVFYLEVDEVIAFVDGRSTCTNLRALTAVRKQEFQAFEAAPAPPDRFATSGLAHHDRVVGRAHAPAVAADDVRQGLGCSPGVVRGRVRIVTDPRSANLAERAILVAEHTDPGWVMVFPSAIGVLVERGSLLSHAAIVTRELGIPAVVAVPGVTRWLRNGDEVEMDGRTGTIRRVLAHA